jgi:hypothetical protein
LRSQVSMTPLLKATTQHSSRAPKRFPLRAIHQIPDSDREEAALVFPGVSRRSTENCPRVS